MASERGFAGWLALGLLLDEPGTGYDVWQRAQRSVAHFWPVTRSGLYAELPRLHERGYVDATEVAQTAYPDKRVYAVTPAGRTAFEEWLAALDPEERPRHPHQLMLFFAAHADTGAAQRLLDSWRRKAESTEAHCRRILLERGHDPETSASDAVASAPARTYQVRTFGCQMNAHDSERIKGMLESLGLGETHDPETADGPPHDPRLLTALFGLRRAQADQAFLDEIAPVLAAGPSTGRQRRAGLPPGRVAR